MSIFKQLVVVLLIAALGAGGYAVYEQVNSAQSSGDQSAGNRRGGGPQVVEIAPAVMRSSAQRQEAVGSTLAKQAIEVVASAAGRVTDIRFAAGEKVKAGQPLVVLDTVIEKADLAQAEAAVIEARLALDRATALSAKNYGPQATVEQLRSKLVAAQAAVDRARKKLDDRTVTAPFDGVVGIRRIDIGARIDDKTVITTLDNLSEVEIEFSLPESIFGQIAIGRGITATTTAFPGRTFSGRVSAVDSRIDSVGRAFKVRATVPNPDYTLPAGMFMLVELVLDTNNKVAIPEAAVVPEASQTFVFVYSEGKVERREVKLGQREVGFVSVTSGLSAGDQVVVKGLARLRDGARVRLPGAPGGRGNPNGDGGWKGKVGEKGKGNGEGKGKAKGDWKGKTGERGKGPGDKRDKSSLGDKPGFQGQSKQKRKDA